MSTKDIAQCTDPAPRGLLATPTTILDLADLCVCVSQRIKSQVLDKYKVPLRRHRTVQWDWLYRSGMCVGVCLLASSSSSSSAHQQNPLTCSSSDNRARFIRARRSHADERGAHLFVNNSAGTGTGWQKESVWVCQGLCVFFLCTLQRLLHCPQLALGSAQLLHNLATRWRRGGGASSVGWHWCRI